MNINKTQILKICMKLKKDLVSFCFLSRGNHNEVYKIVTKQGNYILRIENNLLFKNLKKEYKFLKQINGKFAPKVYLFDNSKKIIKRDYVVQEFIYGKHPKRKVNSDFIKSMAMWYKRLHAIKSKNTPYLTKRGYYSLYYKYKQYKIKFLKLKTVLKGNLQEEISTFFENCDQIFKKHDKIFSRRKNISLNHGDPSRSNVFYTKGSVKLIDWEFVRYDLKEQDLVFFEYSYDLNKSQKKLFLKTYGYSTSNLGKKQIKIVFLLHYLAMITWRIEKLDLLYKGKVDMKQSASNEIKMIKELKEDLNCANKIINRYFK